MRITVLKSLGDYVVAAHWSRRLNCSLLISKQYRDLMIVLSRNDEFADYQLPQPFFNLKYNFLKYGIYSSYKTVFKQFKKIRRNTSKSDYIICTCIKDLVAAKIINHGLLIPLVTIYGPKHILTRSIIISAFALLINKAITIIRWFFIKRVTIEREEISLFPDSKIHTKSICFANVQKLLVRNSVIVCKFKSSMNPCEIVYNNFIELYSLIIAGKLIICADSLQYHFARYMKKKVYMIPNVSYSMYWGAIGETIKL